MLGEFLAKAEKAKGGQPFQRRNSTPAAREGVETLVELLGVEDETAAYKLSAEAQLLAKLKAEAPEQHETVRS